MLFVRDFLVIIAQLKTYKHFMTVITLKTTVVCVQQQKSAIIRGLDLMPLETDKSSL